MRVMRCSLPLARVAPSGGRGPRNNRASRFYALNRKGCRLKDRFIGAKEETADAGGGRAGFGGVLARLGSGVRPEDVRRREGWRDQNGEAHAVDYVEWHTVADLLDRETPDWSHAIRGVIQLGKIIVVMAAITIDGVTREGLGTGPVESETGIKKAEHDALKRAAVKFGVGRDLYRDEGKSGEGNKAGAPGQAGVEPLSTTTGDLITPKQIVLITLLAKDLGADADEICRQKYRSRLCEISRRSASSLIDELRKQVPAR